MATITDATGAVRDLATGKVVGRAEGSATKADILSANVPRRGAASIPSVLQQMSAGFAASLFYVPDAAVQKVGEAFGLKEEEIPQFVSLFKTNITPKNAPERLARSIGQEAGAGVVFSGILRGIASTGALAKELPEGAGFLKKVAKQTLDFIRENPSKAVALDAAYGGAFGAIRQGYEELSPGSGMEKDVAALAGVVAAPTLIGKAAGMLPSVAATRAVRGAIPSIPQGAEGTYAEIMRGGAVPGVLAPFTRPIQKAMLARGEKQIATMMGDIEKSPEAQQMLQSYKELLNDPRIYESFEAAFRASDVPGTPGLDIAQQTMDPALLRSKGEMLDRLTGDLLSQVRRRQTAEKEAFGLAGEALTPAAERGLPTALRNIVDEAQAEQGRIADELEALLGTEVNRVSERFGTGADITRVGSSLRNTIMANNENFFGQFQRMLRQRGLDVGLDKNGIPINTRDADGKSLFPAVDVNRPLTEILSRFKLSKKNLMPSPAPRIVNILARYRSSKAPTEEEILAQFQSIVKTQMGERGYMADSLINDITPIIQKVSRNRKLTPEEIVVLRSKGISPEKIKETYDTAVQAAEANVVVDLNLPEAVQLIDEAAKFRNSQFAFAEDAMMSRKMSKKDATKAIKLGEEVYKDVENMVFKAFPQKMGAQWDEFNRLYRDYYADTYERFFPLIVSRTRGTGAGEFRLPDEAVVTEAFKNSDNMRSLVQILQPDRVAKNKDLLQRAMVDWLRTKGAIDTNTGLVNVGALRRIKSNEAAVLQQMPRDIRGLIDDEIQLGQSYAERVAQVESRAEILKDDEFLGLIKKATRPDADPGEFVLKAIKDPASMRVAVNAMGRDPENLAALRRSVFELARQGAGEGASLANFIDKNQKSLSILFDEGHLNDLRKLSELQTRVFGQKDITGRIPDFQSASEKVRSAFGVSIPGAATYYRDVQSGRISTDGALINLMIRFASAEDERLYNRLIDKFLSDPDFAKNMLDRRLAGRPIDGVPVLNKQTEKVGVYLPALARYGFVTGMNAAMEEQPTELASLPVVPRRPLPPAPPASTARGMLDNMGGPPPTKGIQYGSAFPTEPLRPSAPAGQMSMPTYEALFPNDPLSALLRARQQGQIPQ